MYSVKAYAALEQGAKLEPLNIERRAVLSTDVSIKITHCGVCHSDLHQVMNDWKAAHFPLVPGHEIIGRVTEVGSEVSNFKVGDLVGVGCLVDSCRTCSSCKDDLEQYCEEGSVGTYNGIDTHLGGRTKGGYSQQIVVDQDFVLRVPDNLDPAAAAPLLCAGITTYSPLSHWKIGPGQKVGIVGLGGLGHMGVKFAIAMGAEVYLISRSLNKKEDALALGVKDVILSTDVEQCREHRNTFHFLLNTIPVNHNVDPYMKLLKRDGTMVMVGAIEPLEGVDGTQLILSRKRLAGSLIGGIKETQEMLDFCGQNNIVAEIESIRMDEINEAFSRMQNADVKYRFVIDMDSLH